MGPGLTSTPHSSSSTGSIWTNVSAFEGIHNPPPSPRLSQPILPPETPPPEDTPVPLFPTPMERLIGQDTERGIKLARRWADAFLHKHETEILRTREEMLQPRPITWKPRHEHAKHVLNLDAAKVFDLDESKTGFRNPFLESRRGSTSQSVNRRDGRPARKKIKLVDEQNVPSSSCAVMSADCFADDEDSDSDGEEALKVSLMEYDVEEEMEAGCWSFKDGCNSM